MLKNCGGCQLCQAKIDQLSCPKAYFWRLLFLMIFLPLFTLVALLSLFLRLGVPEILAAGGALAVCFAEYFVLYLYDRNRR
ncbi:MAG: SoxR reducing system RseC family protein [Candidatus Margulisbacteria bacterium]|jgi:hypothetical protein|nr:SoxR reducing system RseC family protein [Candidatus Margulisiibacteriota bacterium]